MSFEPSVESGKIPPDLKSDSCLNGRSHQSDVAPQHKEEIETHICLESKEHVNCLAGLAGFRTSHQEECAHLVHSSREELFEEVEQFVYEVGGSKLEWGEAAIGLPRVKNAEALELVAKLQEAAHALVHDKLEQGADWKEIKDSLKEISDNIKEITWALKDKVFSLTEVTLAHSSEEFEEGLSLAKSQIKILELEEISRGELFHREVERLSGTLASTELSLEDRLKTITEINTLVAWLDKEVRKGVSRAVKGKEDFETTDAMLGAAFNDFEAIRAVLIKEQKRLSENKNLSAAARKELFSETQQNLLGVALVQLRWESAQLNADFENVLNVFNMNEPDAPSAADLSSLSPEQQLRAEHFLNLKKETLELHTWLSGVQETLGVFTESSATQESVEISTDQCRAILSELRQRRGSLRKGLGELQSQGLDFAALSPEQRLCRGVLEDTLDRFEQALSRISQTEGGRVECRSVEKLISFSRSQSTFLSVDEKLQSLEKDKSVLALEFEKIEEVAKQGGITESEYTLSKRLLAKRQERLDRDEAVCRLEVQQQEVMRDMQQGRISFSEFKIRANELEKEMRQALEHSLMAHLAGTSSFSKKGTENSLEEEKDVVERLINRTAVDQEERNRKLFAYRDLQDEIAKAGEWRSSIQSSLESGEVSFAAILEEFEDRRAIISRKANILSDLGVDLDNLPENVPEELKADLKERQEMTNKVREFLARVERISEVLKHLKKEHKESCEIHKEAGVWGDPKVAAAAQNAGDAMAAVGREADDVVAQVQQLQEALEDGRIDKKDYLRHLAHLCEKCGPRVEEAMTELNPAIQTFRETSRSAIESAPHLSLQQKQHYLGRLTALAATTDEAVAAIWRSHYLEYPETQSEMRWDSAVRYQWVPSIGLNLFDAGVHNLAGFLFMNELEELFRLGKTDIFDLEENAIWTLDPHNKRKESSKLLAHDDFERRTFLEEVFRSHLTSQEKRRVQEVLQRLARSYGRSVRADINGKLSAEDRLSALASPHLLKNKEKKETDDFMV